MAGGGGYGATGELTITEATRTIALRLYESLNFEFQ